MLWPRRQLVDIGNRVVCVRVLGRGPTVVLEAPGAGEGTTGAYGGLEERLAEFATVLTYDRAGTGRSDGPPHRRVAQMADDLAAVIHSLGCTTPVVVVAWSAGGMVAEMFAVRHPDKVAGLVLLDPSEMPTGSRIHQGLLLALGAVQTAVFALASRMGVFRGRFGRSLVRRMMPADTSDEGLYYTYLVWNYPKAAWQTVRMLPRFSRYLRETATALRAASLPDVGVRVLVPHDHRGGVPRAYAQRIEPGHRALAQQFPQGELVFADTTSHLIPIDRPTEVIETVRDMLALNPGTEQTAAQVLPPNRTPRRRAGGES